MAKKEKSSSLGDMLGLMRKDKKMSVDTLAERATLPVQLVEDIEQGVVAPSIGVLKKLTRVLQVPMADMFQQAGLSEAEIERVEANKDVVHIRMNERRSLSVKGSRANIQALTPTKVDHNLELLWQEVDARSSGGDFLTHEGEECCFVVRGAIRLHIEDQVYELQEGDSFWFKTFQRHKWENPHDEGAVIMWAITPPYHGAV